MKVTTHFEELDCPKCGAKAQATTGFWKALVLRAAYCLAAGNGGVVTCLRCYHKWEWTGGVK
jgi:hypothetical protein